MFEIKKRLKRNTKAMSNVFMIVTRGILLGCIVGDLGSGLGGDIAGKKKKKFGLVLSFFDFFSVFLRASFFLNNVRTKPKSQGWGRKSDAKLN
jgi:hypothetical protein